ncbi:MAG: PG0541 family transporter-associated protein [Dysgonamonadaceae bacterium]|jgi:hypothetical protein|nr:hypothetical protein [Dysgonamonadaceae bacterium]MDD3495052.1 hypothetical protein [Dysgonamonadaceae bacterium]MDD4379792.1 hypothetical protein [Dysgonamonadaceae bacterium]HXL00438.1 hypothetical protein [Dysgonamonadaceae bacterium]
MKLIYCTCNVSMLETLVEVIEEEKISEYQIVEQVLAKSRRSEPRLNTAVWPGYNSAVFMQVNDEEKVINFVNRIKEVNGSIFNPAELITVCVWKLDDYIFE